MNATSESPASPSTSPRKLVSLRASAQRASQKGMGDRRPGMSDVEEPLEDWVLVQPGPCQWSWRPPEEHAPKSLGPAVTAAAVSGAAGLLVAGPVTCTALAIAAAASKMDSGSTETAVRVGKKAGRHAYELLNSARMRALAGSSQSTDGESEDILQKLSGGVLVAADKAREKLIEARRTLTGEALAERDGLIANLRKNSEQMADRLRNQEEKRQVLSKEYEMLQRNHQCETTRLADELEALERQWREDSDRLSSELEAAEQGRTEDSERLRREIDSARLAKDEEVGKLAKELESNERAWEACKEQLLEAERQRAAETHRLEAAEAELERLAAELAQAEESKEEEREQLQRALQEAQVARESEAEVLQRALEERERLENLTTSNREQRAQELAAKNEEIQRLERALEIAEQGASSDAARLRRELDAERLAKEAEGEKSLCCVCMNAQRQILFLPCKHIAVCSGCASRLRECPIDRTRIEERIHFISS